MKKMATIRKEKEGLCEIDGFAWLITCWGRAYIYNGHPDGLQDAVRRVKRDPKNAGSTVRYKKIIG
jgi:hypothetical protein